MKLLYANGEPGQHAPSWYAATCETVAYAPLAESISVDVCVVGAGYTGLSTALHLAQLGHSVAVVDAHRVGWGASGRNGGQLGSGFNLGQSELEKRFGKPAAASLWQLCEQAKACIHQLCREYDIDIEYRPGIIHALHKARHVDALHRDSETLAANYGYKELQTLDRQALRDLVDSPVYHGGVIDHGAGHIHPLKLATGLASAAAKLGVSIFEQTAVTMIEPARGAGGRAGERSDAARIHNGVSGSSQHIVRTANGTIKARHIVIACNGYIDGLHKQVQSHVMPINNFVIATEPLGERADTLLSGNHSVFDSKFVVNYFRLSSDKRLLFGGGETYRYRFPQDIGGKVRQAMLQVFPQLDDVAVDYAWGGTLGLTRSRLPYARQIQDRIYTAGGYSGHGVSLSVLCGQLMADAIHGDTEKFNMLAALPAGRFPGAGVVRSGLLLGAMSWYSFRDRW